MRYLLRVGADSRHVPTIATARSGHVLIHHVSVLSSGFRKLIVIGMVAPAFSCQIGMVTREGVVAGYMQLV